jgi:hypothetical protein
MKLNQTLRFRANTDLSDQLKHISKSQNLTPSEFIRKNINDAYLELLQTA